MEDFKFKCDHCGLKIETSTNQAGQMINCPGCRQPIEIPARPEQPAAQAARTSLPTRTIPMAEAWDIPARNESTDSGSHHHAKQNEEIPVDPDAPRYKVVPIALSPDEERTPAAVARKVERTIQAFSVGGWRFLRIDAITYETKGALGIKEELAQLAIFIRE
jgi:DNA-directed RNA polymerase subunit RPC12/RpoP